MRGFFKWAGIGCGGLIVIIIAITIGVGLGGGGGGSEQAGSGDGSDGSQSSSNNGGGGNGSEQPQASIGDRIEDGQFAFTVNGVEQAQQLGQGAFATQAQGKYVIVNMSAENVSDEAATFNAGTSQVAFDSQGREYQTSEDAMMSGDAADEASFLQQINPGSSVDGRLVYDVPEETQLTSVELHGGTFSEGVEVSLQ